MPICLYISPIMISHESIARQKSDIHVLNDDDDLIGEQLTFIAVHAFV